AVAPRRPAAVPVAAWRGVIVHADEREAPVVGNVGIDLERPAGSAAEKPLRRQRNGCEKHREHGETRHRPRVRHAASKELECRRCFRRTDIMHPRIMKFTLAAVAATATAISGNVSTFGQAMMAPTNSAANPYNSVEGFFKLPAGREWGSTSAVEI